MRNGAIRLLVLTEKGGGESGDMAAPLFDALSRCTPEGGRNYAVALFTVPNHRCEQIGDWYADLLDELGWDQAVLVVHKASTMLETGNIPWERVKGLFLIDAQDAKTVAARSPLPHTSKLPTTTSLSNTASRQHTASLPTLLVTTGLTTPTHAELYRLPAAEAHMLGSPAHLLELLHAFCHLRAYPA